MVVYFCKPSTNTVRKDTEVEEMPGSLRDTFTYSVLGSGRKKQKNKRDHLNKVEVEDQFLEFDLWLPQANHGMGVQTWKLNKIRASEMIQWVKSLLVTQTSVPGLTWLKGRTYSHRLSSDHTCNMAHEHTLLISEKNLKWSGKMAQWLKALAVQVWKPCKSQV